MANRRLDRLAAPSSTVPWRRARCTILGGNCRIGYLAYVGGKVMRKATVSFAWAVVLAAAAVSGCQRRQTWEFTEEVRLNDGRTITLRRVAHRNDVWPSISQDGRHAVVWHGLAAPALGVKAAFTAFPEKGELPVHQVYSLGVVDGAVVIVGSPTGPSVTVLDFCKHNPDGLAVLMYRWDGNGWSTTTPSDTVVRSLTANVLQVLDWGDSPPRPDLTLTGKNEHSRNLPNQPDYANPPPLRDYLAGRYYSTCDALLRR